jgi:polar amino acid transport system ATP-binding protein
VHVKGRSEQDAVTRAEALLARVGLSDHRDKYPAALSGDGSGRHTVRRTNFCTGSRNGGRGA